MTRFLFTILLALPFSILILLSACHRKSDPNIIIIFMDDQGYADLGCYGAVGFTTPNIDVLAAKGMKFTSFYVSEAVCSASRSSLLTGSYAQRVGIRGALSPFAMTGLNPEEETIASLLKKQGYRTGMVGKWHLGSRPEFYPTNYGFDEYFGIPYSNDMWPVSYDGVSLDEGFKSIYPVLPLINNTSIVGEIRTMKDQDKITSLYTQRALQFIENNAGSPFFLYLAHSMVHVPLGVSDEFRGSSEQGMYGDVMQEIDASVGEIMNKIWELGISENTLVIFTSDNGPWLNFGNHAGSAYPLREGKGNAWEGGVRVPCIMHWPGHIPKGSVTHNMASTLDLLPTIAAITSQALSENTIDGVNILPLMEGNHDYHPRNEFYYFYDGGLCAVRRGDWKLVLPHNYRSYKGVEPGMDGLPGKYSRGTAGLELYNLKYDVSESVNEVDNYPDVVTELSNLADSVRSVLGDQHTNTKGTDNRSPGRIRAIDTVFRHIGFNSTYSLINAPSHRYPGGTEFALTDGYRGSLEFSDESWCGFHGEDIDITIDLKKRRELSEIELSFLRNQASWIFLPESISISVSDDGRNFRVLSEQSFENSEKDLEILIRPFSWSGSTNTQYLKIRANNIGTCPEWHPGKGQQAWLFLDEVIIN